MPTTSTTRPRVIVGLSGGVDSSVSAWVLQQKGYEVQGLFMKNWEDESRTGPCSASRDLADAQAVCDHLGITLHTANFSEEYWEEVFIDFLKEYQANRTPNPDILCNKSIKFKHFLNYAQQLGADYIATGHYAQKKTINGQHALGVSVDSNKDQTYFLYTLNQTQLSSVLFPLAEITKPEVREHAARIGLANHAKKDSVGICFIGKRDFKTFLKQYLPPNPGLIQTLEGQTIGQHEGLMYYTIGQRKGLGIGGRKECEMHPWYVVGKEIEKNILKVVQGHHHPLLYTHTIQCDRVHWISDTPQTYPLVCLAKIRYRQTASACTVSALEHGKYQVQFSAPQWAAAPGQSIVFYQEDLCLGGGIIL